jgi:hypothetical protein
VAPSLRAGGPARPATPQGPLTRREPDLEASQETCGPAREAHVQVSTSALSVPAGLRVGPVRPGPARSGPARLLPAPPVMQPPPPPQASRSESRPPPSQLAAVQTPRARARAPSYSPNSNSAMRSYRNEDNEARPHPVPVSHWHIAIGESLFHVASESEIRVSQSLPSGCRTSPGPRSSAGSESVVPVAAPPIRVRVTDRIRNLNDSEDSGRTWVTMTARRLGWRAMPRPGPGYGPT